MSKVSLFNGVKDTKAKDIIELRDFLNGIYYGQWKSQVEEIRSIADKKKRDEKKKALPLVTVSGTFEKRGQDNLISHSGFLCLDIDGADEEDREAIEKDPYTFSCFASASGNGLAMIVKVKPEKHKDSFNWMQKYLSENYGITVDPAPKNVASLRAASYDPRLLINEKSRKSNTKKKEQTKKPQTIPVVAEREEVAEAVKAVVSSGIDIAPDYETYRNLGFALANGFGEEGRDWFHALCSNSDKYKEAQADKQYDYCMAGRNRAGITVGTFYWLLKEHGGVEVKGKSEKAIQVASIAKMNDRPKESAKKQLTDLEGLAENDAEKIAEEVWSREDLQVNALTKDPEALIDNLFEWMRQNHQIRRNQVTRRLEEVVNGKPQKLTQEAINTIYLRARKAFKDGKVTSELVEKLLFSNLIEEYDPIQEYIEANRSRESTGNIDQLISCLDTPTPSAAQFIRKWLIGLAAAAHWDPPRTVLVFIGPGSTGKTSFFRTLLPKGLRDLYAESSLTRGSDDELLMCNKLLINDDEMAGKNKRDYRKFKEMASKQTFNLRVPYGRYNDEFQRLAVLSATSNESEVISDPTVNTRILPIFVRGIDLEGLNKVDRDELFMELVRAYEDGEEHRLSREELEQLESTSKPFEEIHMEEEAISMFFEKPQEGEGGMEMTSTEIKEEIEAHSHQRIQNERKLGNALRSIFGEPQVVSRRGIKRRVYRVKYIPSTTGNGRPDEQSESQEAKLPGIEPREDQQDLPF